MSAFEQRPIMVTGGQGQLATSMKYLAHDRVVVVGRPTFDFDRTETLEDTLTRLAPEVVVNAAAWTAVDLAEKEPEAARRVNETGPAQLARLCAERKIPLIHISTDYVFAGDKGTPYVETDEVKPQTVYGHTKADGERAVLAANPRTIILRTSWVYAGHGKNFVRTMLNAGAKNTYLKVVGDQYGSPTNADHLAEAILAIVARLHEGWRDAYAGIYHASGMGETSWHGLAVASLEEACHYGQTPLPTVTAIATEDWPTPAKRPQDSRLDCTKLKNTFGIVLPHWRDGVASAVRKHFEGLQSS